MTSEGGVDAAGNDLDGGTSRAAGLGGIRASLEPSGRLYGPPAAPTDLLHFVQGVTIAQAMRELALARGTVWRLRHGYWPEDPRKIAHAWDRYKVRHGVVVSSWFLRRVYPGGVVRHAGRDYTALQLAARTGQMLAVAREAQGQLLAQTLELPAERLPLELLSKWNEPQQSQEAPV